MRRRPPLLHAALALAALVACRPGRPARDVSAAPAATRAMLFRPDDGFWRTAAPETTRVRVETTQGPFVLELHRRAAPIGVDHLYNLVRAGYYDDSRFFRVAPNYIVQFGIAGDPAVNAIWNERPIADDPESGSNRRGTFGFSMRGPNDRRTQLYINLVDNTKNDGQGFALLGRVVEGMDVVDRIYGGYGEAAVGGMRAGRQQRALTEGNAYLDQAFPRMDHLVRATVVPRTH